MSQQQPEAQQPPQDDGLADTVALIVAIFASGVAVATAAGMIATILAPLGIGADAARSALVLALSNPLRPRMTARTIVNIQVHVDPGKPPGPAEIAAAGQALEWRARFLIASARRIDDRSTRGLSAADAVAAERGFMQMHITAQRRRVEAAQAVDAAAGLYGRELGWYANGDERTTAECRWADGRNFYADRPPVFGYPGAVHPRCRCTAGPAHEGARLLYAAPARLMNLHTPATVPGGARRGDLPRRSTG